MKNNIINQTGRSMIEMLGVLAIVGVLSVGGIAGYSKAMQKYRTNKTIEQVTQIANGVRTLYSGRQNYNGLSREVLVKTKILTNISSANFESDDSYEINAANPFGGNIGITESEAQIDNGKSFLLRMTGIPQDACIEIATQDWGDASGLIGFGITSFDSHTGLINFHIGSRTSCSNQGGSDMVIQCAKNGPMSIDKAMNACGSDSDNTIVWQFF